LLALSFVSLSFGNFASAYYVVADNFLPNNKVDGLDTDKEVQLSEGIAAYIHSELSKLYPTRTRYNCTKNTYTDDLIEAQGYDKVVTFSKGHRSRVDGHYALVDKVGANLTDHEIFLYTSTSRNVVTFIWHCATADGYMPNGININGTGHAINMPYAWTSANNLANYGTSGSQVYLGWTTKYNLTIYNMTSHQYEPAPNVHPNPQFAGIIGSPQYEWGINPNYDYAQVAKLFWMFMAQGYTVKDALDATTIIIYNNALMSFTSNGNVLKDWLIVYGNRNVKLPADYGHRYVSKVAPGSPTHIGSGYVSNANGITGRYPDGNLAFIYGINSGAGGHIVGELNGVARGTVWVYAASVHGYNTRIQVFVSNDGVNWVSMGSRTVQGGVGWRWVDFGVYNNDFKYIGVAAINQYGNEPVNVYIDLADVTR